jgi:O-antigen ligase
VGLLAAAIAFASSRSPVATLAALGLVILGLLTVTQPQALLVLLVVALPWERMLNFPTETVSVVKLIGLLLFLSVALSVLRGHRDLHMPPIGLAVALFGLAVTLSLLFSPDAGAGTSKVLRYVLFVAFFFVVVELIDSRDRLMTVLRAVSLSVAGAALWGLVLFVNGDVERASGPIADANDYGFLMAAALPLVAYLFIEDRGRRRLWGVCVPVVLAALLATLSRGVIVSISVLIIWAVLTRRITVGGLLASAAVLVTVAGIAVFAFAPLIDERLEQKGQIASDNIASRAALWESAIAMSEDRPLTGVGPGRFGAETVDYLRDNPVVLENPVTHNTYLEILAESGPLALGAFIAFLIGTWVSLRRGERAGVAAGDRTAARLAAAMEASLLVAVVGAFFLSEELATPFWLIGALAAAAPRAYAVSAKRVAEPGGVPGPRRARGALAFE